MPFLLTNLQSNDTSQLWEWPLVYIKLSIKLSPNIYSEHSKSTHRNSTRFGTACSTIYKNILRIAPNNKKIISIKSISNNTPNVSTDEHHLVNVQFSFDCIYNSILVTTPTRAIVPKPHHQKPTTTNNYA